MQKPGCGLVSTCTQKLLNSSLTCRVLRHNIASTNTAIVYVITDNIDGVQVASLPRRRALRENVQRPCKKEKRSMTKRRLTGKQFYRGLLLSYLAPSDTYKRIPLHKHYQYFKKLDKVIIYLRLIWVLVLSS